MGDIATPPPPPSVRLSVLWGGGGVVLASEFVGGRYQATELPYHDLIHMQTHKLSTHHEDVMDTVFGPPLCTIVRLNRISPSSEHE